MTLFKYTIKKAIKYMIILLTIVIFLLIGNTNTLLVHAESVDITTSSVRDDLKSMDEDKLSYLSDEDFIFIAMSQYYDKEENLRTYLYVNFPYGQIVFDDYHAFANILTSVMDENYNITEDFELYSIKYVNHEETWYKLEVLNLPNLEETTRRYYIQDFRTYMNSLENTSSLDDYMSCDEVNKVYIFNGVSNNTIKVFREEIETITITEKELKFYCYGDSANLLWWDTGQLDGGNVANKGGDIYTDAWYVFFNTDKPMDELMEIELTYTQYDYHFEGVIGGTDYLKMQYAYTEEAIELYKQNPIQENNFESGVSYVTYHEAKPIIKTPGKDKVSYIDKGWFGKYDTYYEELDNIIDLKKYKAENGDKFVFTKEAEKYNWAVHFLDTKKQSTFTGTAMGEISMYNLDGSGMSDVAILRLKYKTNGIVHNAYAVDTPTSDFTGEAVDEDTKFEEWFEKILMLIGILILVVILGYCAPIFTTIFNVFIKLLTWAFKGILLIISAPFKLIGNLFKPKKRK